MNIQNQIIENQEITINDKTKFNSIGSEVVLNNCTIKIEVPSKSLSINGKLIGCTVIAKKELHGFPWTEAHLEEVKFIGKFTNNLFGSFPPMYQGGFINNCDFSEATLKEARFFNVKNKKLIFPKWPHLTILDRHQLTQDLKRIDIDERIIDLFEIIEEMEEDLDILTMNCEDLAKLDEVPIELYKNVAKQLSNVEF